MQEGGDHKPQTPSQTTRRKGKKATSPEAARSHHGTAGTAGPIHSCLAAGAANGGGPLAWAAGERQARQHPRGCKTKNSVTGRTGEPSGKRRGSSGPSKRSTADEGGRMERGKKTKSTRRWRETERQGAEEAKRNPIDRYVEAGRYFGSHNCRKVIEWLLTSLFFSFYLAEGEETTRKQYTGADVARPRSQECLRIDE